MRGEDEGARTCEEYPHVTEWEAGLPSSDDLMPLSQPLIPAELASAFSIYTEPSRTALDVARASHSTVSALRSRLVSSFPPSGLDSLPSLEEEDAAAAADSVKGRRLDLAAGEEPDDDQSARTLKRPRLVWTPQLHKRFVDVVAHLGIKNAVPKTIMQLMNVEGLTRENVASHLQKYRLYLKRMQGFSGDGPSSSDPLFASTPVPQSLHDPGDHPVSIPSPFLPMPVLGVVPHEGYRSEHLPPMPMNNPGPSGTSYRGFESHPYNIFSEQRRDWLGNKFRSTPFYPHLMQGDK